MELIFNGFIAIVLMVFLVFSMNLEGMTISSDVIGAGGFPRVISLISLMLLAYITYKNIKDKSKSENKEAFDFKDKGFKIMILSIGLLGVYIFTLNTVGFMLGTLVFSVIAVKIMGYDDNLKAIIFSVVLTVAITLVFGKVFFVSLPRGIGFLREISYLIY